MRAVHLFPESAWSLLSLSPPMSKLFLFSGLTQEESAAHARVQALLWSSKSPPSHAELRHLVLAQQVFPVKRCCPPQQ